MDLRGIYLGFIIQIRILTEATCIILDFAVTMNGKAMVNIGYISAIKTKKRTICPLINENT